MKSENEKPKLNAWSCDWMDYYTEQAQRPGLTSIEELELAAAGWLEVAVMDFRRQGTCSSVILGIVVDEVRKVLTAREESKGG